MLAQMDSKLDLSLPLRKCGLKSRFSADVNLHYIVTSLAEVWIEIYYMQKNEKLE